MNKGYILKISTIIIAVMTFIMIIFATFQQTKTQLKAQAGVSVNYNIKTWNPLLSPTNKNEAYTYITDSSNEYDTIDIIITCTSWVTVGTLTVTLSGLNKTYYITEDTIITALKNDAQVIVLNIKRSETQSGISINNTIILYNTDGSSYDQGYNDGEKAGLQTAQYGIWANGKATITGQYEINDTTTYNYTENINPINNYCIYNAIDTQKIYNYLENKYCISTSDPDQYGTINTANITVTLQNTIQYTQNTYPLIWNGSNLGVTITLIDNNNNQYSVSLYDDENTTNEKGYINFPETATNKMITKIKVSFAGAYNSMMGTIVAVNGNYTSGYDNGYNEGYSDGTDYGYNKGYQSGYEKGIITGQQNATFENLTGFELLSSGLATIFKALEVPILWGKMSFADMISIILSIGLAFALIRFIVG